MNRVAVVVLNYKGIEDTISCLASLSAQTYKNFTIIAVENGSHDGSAEKFKELKKKYDKKVHTIYNQENLGFDGGVNTGITWALDHDFEYIVLFNNDAIADKKWLEILVKTADAQKEAGIVTGLLLHQDGKTIDSTGDWFSTWGLPFPRNRDNPTSEAPASEYVFGASAGASLYRVKMLQEIGIFDNDFFAYYEDADISFRAQLAGWKVYYEAKAIAYHQQSATSKRMYSGFMVHQTFKNLPLLFTKNVPSGLLFSIGIRFWPAYFLMLGNAIKNGNGKVALTGYFKSIGLFWTHALAERHQIQAAKKVSNNYIRSILWPDLPPDQTGLRKLRRIFTGKP